MTDRVYPSSKPTANGSGGSTPGAVKPPNKGQLYNPTRPAFRPPPRPSRSVGRSCCCRCCLWTTITLFMIIVLAAVSGGILWAIYRPRHPSFSVSSLQVSRFGFPTASSGRLDSRFNLTVSARNPNNRIAFSYDPISVSLNSDDINVGEGTFQGFVHGTENTTIMRALVSSNGDETLDNTAASTLRRNRNGLPLKIQMDTKVEVRVGELRTRKVRIRVTCDGISASLPTRRAATVATPTDAKCDVDLRIRIWRWTF